MSRNRFSLYSAILIALLAGAGSVAARAQSQAQSSTPSAQDSTQNQQDNQDPLKRQLSDKERFKQQKELRQEIGTAYKKWLDEDVRWIITDQEKKAFHEPQQRRGTGRVYRAVLAAAESRTRIRRKMSSAKSTTGALPMRTSISRRASRAG